MVGCAPQATGLLDGYSVGKEPPETAVPLNTVHHFAPVYLENLLERAGLAVVVGAGVALTSVIVVVGSKKVNSRVKSEDLDSTTVVVGGSYSTGVGPAMFQMTMFSSAERVGT